MRCTDAETYVDCATSAGGHSQFNLDPLLDVNRFADVDANPYVVGSAAYNMAHGLPPPETLWIEGADRLQQRHEAAQRAAAAAVAARGTVPGSPVLRAGAAAVIQPAASLAPLILVGLAILLVFRR